jgi:acetoin utilization deacetylase AcuC-like enzyme
VAIVDYDVHHGNGTQQCFWDDPDCLFVSIHQDNNYPKDSGAVYETGGAVAKGATINIPLPPGSFQFFVFFDPFLYHFI